MSPFYKHINLVSELHYISNGLTSEIPTKQRTLYEVLAKTFQGRRNIVRK